MEVANQRKAGVMLSYINLGITLLFSILYTPFMLRLLGPEQHGVYKAVASITSYLSLFSLGFGSSYLRFYSRYRTQDKKDDLARLNALFLIFFGSAAALALICGILLSFFPKAIFGEKLSSDELMTSAKLTVLMALQISVSFVSTVFSMYIGAKERFIFARILTIFTSVGVPLTTLLFLVYGWGSIGLVAAEMLFSICTMIANFFFAKKCGFSCLFNHLKWSLFREVTSFSLWIFAQTVLSTIQSSIDVLIISRKIGSAAISVYSIGNEFLSYLLSFIMVISDVFRPSIYFLVSDKRPMRELTDKVIQISRVQYYILSLIIGGFAVFGRYFVILYAGEAYKDSYWVALLMMLACLTAYIQNICLEILKAMNKHAFRAILLSTASLFNIALTIPLTISYGVIGAAIGSAVSLVISTGIIMNIYYYKVIGLDIPRYWRTLSKPILISLIPFILFLFLSFFIRENILSFILGIASYILVFVILQWIFALNTEEKELIRNMFHYFRKERC